jgi:phage gpG-like protein
MTVRLQLPDRKPLWTSKDASTLADEQAERVVKRVKAGRGSDGRRFKKKADGSPSTLRDTGRLHAAITGSAKGDVARIIADVPYAEAVDAERPFLAPTDKERAEIEKTIRSTVDDRLGVKR